MIPKSKLIQALLLAFAVWMILLPPAAHARLLKKEPEVPEWLNWKRSIDIEGYWHTDTTDGNGSQNGRLRFRYEDPEVNALVGLIAEVSHFDQKLSIGNPGDQHSSNALGNIGILAGIRRGTHLGEIDVMASILGNQVGMGVAIVGEHRLAAPLIFYHRTEGNFFSGDTVLDADQGVYWMWTPRFGVSAGYRIFTSQHDNRNGPRAGIRLYFESPKIPFLFPSLG